MANRKFGGVGQRLWVSAWLPPGLALGWLAVLSAFVHGTGVLLADWAATTALGLLAVLTVLVLRRRAASTADPQTAIQPSPASSGTTEPAQPGDGAGKPVASTTHDADLSPLASSSAQPMAQDNAPDSAPKAELVAASIPTAGPVAAELAVTLGLHVLTGAEVASVLRVDAKVIAKAISNGELPGNRIGGDWRVDLSALRRWLQGRYPAPGAISGPAAQAVFGDEQS